MLRLAVPALGALIAEPLFLLADAAIVGRLGPVPLARLVTLAWRSRGSGWLRTGAVRR